MTKILVVEDEAGIRESIVDMLELDDYEILEAENGAEGLELARAHRPDLIVSDIMMPVLDGYGLFNALQDDLETAVIPFIFLTAMANYSDLRTGMNLGADDYVIKPFDYEQLSEAIRTRLDKHVADNAMRLRLFVQKLIRKQEQENQLLAAKLVQQSEEIAGLKLLCNLANEHDIALPKEEAVQTIDRLRENLKGLITVLSPTAMVEQLNIVPILSWLFKFHAEQSGLQVDFKRSGHAIEIDQASKLSVFRIFEEIMTNIGKHAHCSLVTIRIHATPSELTASVQDDGVGFRWQEVQTLGTLGMEQMIERAAILGGTLNVKSVPGEGTQVTFVMPLEKTAVSPAQEFTASTPDKPANASPNNKLTLVIAESQDIIRFGLRQLFSHTPNLSLIDDMSTTTALLNCLNATLPDVLVLDLMLEEISGFELIKTLKFQYPTLKIIAFSDKEQEIYASEALKSGANGYLLKSAGTIEMVEAIETVAKGESFVSHKIESTVQEYLDRKDWQGYTPFESLTSREREIMFLVINGLKSAEISEKLVISQRTVEKHRSNLMSKLGLKSPAQLMRFASEMGLLEE